MTRDLKPQRRLTQIILIMIVWILLDQATKALAQAYLPDHTLHLLNDLVRLHLSENTGAFLGLGAALSASLRFWIFTVAAALMLIGVTFYAATSPELPRDAVLALASVAGGGLSNLIDRVLHQGAVVDFLNFGIGNLRTGILNVADIAITFGALYAVWATAREEVGEREDEEADGPIDSGDDE
jgi:signal peptidase II